MRRRRDDSERRTFPVELLDLPLPLSDEDRIRVDAAREAAGWSVLTYLGARIQRRRARMGWVGNMPPAEPRRDER